MQVTQVQQQTSFGGDMLQSAATRGVRDLMGKELDKHFSFKPMNVPKVDFFSYENIFGLDSEYHAGSIKQVLGTAQGRNELKQLVQYNFTAPKSGPQSLKEFAAKTLYGANASIITKPLAEGKVFTAASKLGGLGLGVAPVIAKTANVFNTTHSVTQAAGTFAKEAVKETTAWEVGTIAYAVGKALLPVAGLRVVAALASMAFASNATRRVLD